MRKLFRLISIFLLFCIVLCSCSKVSSVLPSVGGTSNSTFSITFIDVGQGDSALIECDGRYMLIDGGDVSAGKTVYNKLVEKGVNHLDILAISHFDMDHFGGIAKALDYASSIDLTICNSNDIFADIEPDEEAGGYNVDKAETKKNREKALSELDGKLRNCSKITRVPSVGEKFELGSAEIEIIDVASAERNDSLVLLITYGKNKFLFTGDIEYNAQKRIYEKFLSEYNGDFKIDLMKIPHHGACLTEAYDPITGEYSGMVYEFFNTFMPDYSIISVGMNNRYQHPSEATIKFIQQADSAIKRIDECGDIIVKSDGKEISVTTSK